MWNVTGQNCISKFCNAMVVHGPLSLGGPRTSQERKAPSLSHEKSLQNRPRNATLNFGTLTIQKKISIRQRCGELRLPKVRQLENLRKVLLSWKLNPCARTTDVALLYETTCSSDNRTLIWHEANPSSVKNMQAHRTVFKGNNKGIHNAIPCFLPSAVSFHPVVPQSSQLLLAVFAAHKAQRWS